jgi:hypothetical protein
VGSGRRVGAGVPPRRRALGAHADGLLAAPDPRRPSTAGAGANAGAGARGSNPLTRLLALTAMMLVRGVLLAMGQAPTAER